MVGFSILLENAFLAFIFRRGVDKSLKKNTRLHVSNSRIAFIYTLHTHIHYTMIHIQVPPYWLVHTDTKEMVVYESGGGDGGSWVLKSQRSRR